MIGADPKTSIPGTLFWAYQDSLNRQADLLFWHQTRYKPNQKLSAGDPQDRAMFPTWLATRASIEQSRSPRELIRERAIEKMYDVHLHDPQPVFVHSLGAGGAETVAFPALGGQREDDYVHARMRDSSYVAIFNVNDPRWPRPVYEVYPQSEIEIDQPSPNVSGAVERGCYRNGLGKASGEASPVIHHDNLVLRPLTPDVIARLSDLDPVRRDARVKAVNGAWIDFCGNRQPVRLVSDVCQPGDTLYYWDGPWGVLAGSRGIAVVRHGVVVETFTTLVS
jgi:hypothetical protein